MLYHRAVLLGVAFTLFVASFAEAGEAKNAVKDDWIIVPGVKVGKITASATFEQLQELYGKENVEKAEIPVGEGFTKQGVIVYPNDPKKILSIIWEQDAYENTMSVIIDNEGTVWKTDKGITIGTSLKEIEALNKKAFVLTGFEWDYSGTIIHSNGGALKELGTDENGLRNRTLVLRLAPESDAQGSDEYQGVSGDRYFTSDNPSMQKLNPRVYQMIIDMK